MTGEKRGAVREWAGRLLLTAALLMTAVSAVIGAWPEAFGDVRFAAVARATVQAAPIPLPEGTVDVNGGDLDELMLLNGVGETLGQAILDERAAHGRFFYPEDLLGVKGIGDKKLTGFREQLDLTEK